VTIITLQIKGTLNSWKKTFSVLRDGLKQYYARDLSDLSKNKGTM
jgi:hypothetical protein